MTRQNVLGRLLGVALATLLVAAVLPSQGSAQISVVVAAGSSHSADLDAVARMFSGQVTSWPDGAKVQLVDQSETEVGKTFYDKVLKKSPAQVRKALMALLLSGQIAKPEQAGSDADVKAAVARMAGSIGFIASSSLDGTVKELVKIP